MKCIMETTGNCITEKIADQLYFVERISMEKSNVLLFNLLKILKTFCHPSMAHELQVFLYGCKQLTFDIHVKN